MIGVSEIYRVYQDKKIEKNLDLTCVRYSCFKNYENIPKLNFTMKHPLFGEQINLRERQLIYLANITQD
jgi:hypothetical protein